MWSSCRIPRCPGRRRAVTRRAIAAQRGAVLLVGHSYGGAVITEAGTDPKVAGLVYIAAFAPDKGESVSSLIKDIRRPARRFLQSCRRRTASCSSTRPSSTSPSRPTLDVDTAAFMASSQVPWGVGALAETITEPAWRTKPSWYLVSTEDRMIPPAGPARHVEARRLDVAEVAGSHAVYVSQPKSVATFIEKAASEVAATSK